jgi:hypothetical protein
MTASRVDIVRAQLDRTNSEWNRATAQLRDVLVGLAGEIDGLDRRVRELEQQRPVAGEASGERA